jgi:hypothetical protein
MGRARVLTWNMVDNSTSSFECISGWFFRQWTVHAGHLFLGEAQPTSSADPYTTACHDTATAPGFLGSQAETGAKGHESTSRAVHRRLVLPAA